MINRRSNSFASNVKDLITMVEELKTTQYFGDDTTLIQAFESGNTYDEMVTIDGFDRISRFFRFTPIVKPWQLSTYTQLHIQVYVDSMSNPYQGESTDTISVLPPGEYNLDMIPQMRQQIVNLDFNPHTIYIKYYVVTTAIGGTVHVTT